MESQWNPFDVEELGCDILVQKGGKWLAFVYFQI